MATPFQSKYCLPKKIPGYFEEFIGYLEANNKIDGAVSRNFLQTAQLTWPEYAACGKEKKPRTKKADSKKEARANDDGDANPPVKTPRAVVHKLQQFIDRTVANAELKACMLQVLHQFSSQDC